MNKKQILQKRLYNFKKKQKNLEGNYTDKIINLERRIKEINNKENKKKYKINIITLLTILFFIICFTIIGFLIYKEIKTPILNHDEAIIYFNDGAKCLGFQTGTWKKDVKNARKVKIEYKGEKFWFYTDFDSAREFWNKYQK